MKIVAFCGSPRKNGNTETLMNWAVQGIEDSGPRVEKIHLNLMKIKPCQNCGGCDESGVCIMNDDMGYIYSMIREADRIILASPVFFFSLSAQTKLMIDRCQCFWCEKCLLKKPVEAGKFGRKGLLLMVGGMKKEIGVQCGEVCARAFFRTVSVSEHETLYYLGIDSKSEITKHPTVLNDAYEAGKRLVALTN